MAVFSSAPHEDQQRSGPEVEGEIRKLVRRDAAQLLRPQSDAGELGANNLNSIIQRVSGMSVMNRQAHCRAADAAGLLAERRPARPAGGCGICAYEPGGNQVDEDHRRKPGAMETTARK